MANRIPITEMGDCETEQRQDAAVAKYWNILQAVKDPELPAVSIGELGILRNIMIEGDQLVVVITPTYSGCPAMEVITQDIYSQLKEHGVDKVEVKMQLFPAWTSDWINDAAKKKLLDNGISPASKCGDSEADIICPHCRHSQVSQISQFGSTACKAMFRCDVCLEVFDYFKAF